MVVWNLASLPFYKTTFDLTMSILALVVCAYNLVEMAWFWPKRQARLAQRIREAELHMETIMRMRRRTEYQPTHNWKREGF